LNNLLEKAGERNHIIGYKHLSSSSSYKIIVRLSQLAVHVTNAVEVYTESS